MIDQLDDETTLPDRLLKAALKYARRGWRVLPLRPGTKIPLLEDWTTEATTDPEKIVEWWTENPRANIGIATGKASGLWVLDVDTKAGKRGKKSLAKLQRKNGNLPPTYTVRTASGGQHLYFNYPDGEGEWRNSATYLNAKTGKKQGPLELDLDVRAEGGQVVAPPSIMRDGTAYKRVVGNPRADLPDWLAVKTRYVEPLRPERPTIDPASLSEADKSRLGRWTIATVGGVTADLKELATAATENGQGYTGAPWNQTVFNAACRLLEVARASWSPLSEGDAYDVLFTNAPRDKGFTDRDVDAIFASAAKRVGDKELAVPEAVSGVYMIPIGDREATASERSGRRDPDSFFQKGEGLLTERLADVVSDDLAVGIDGRFWAYRGGVWASDQDELVRRVVRALGDRYRPAYTAAVADVVRATAPRLSAEPLPDLINTRSGMVDWRTGAVLPHDPSYLSTVQLPLDYDPEATCPAFDAWLGEVVSKETAALIWEMIGYLIMSGNPLQVAFLLYGDGGNGKGTILRLITRILGRWNCSAVTLRSISDGKFEVAGLLGKTANIAGDIDNRYLRDSSKFKTLTGGDEVEAQHKHKDPFTFTNWAVPVFSANELWRSADTTEGYFDRWVTVPFNKRVRRTGPFDEATLHAEASGIFNKALAALRALMERSKFELLGDAADLSRQFVEESDLLRLWFREDDHVIAAEAGQRGFGAPKVNRTLLHRAFRNWARESGHGELSSTSFYKRLRRNGFIETRGADGWSFYGIRLDVVGGMIPTGPLPQTSAAWALSGPGDEDD